MAAYDPDNIFAKIIRGDIPSHKVRLRALCIPPNQLTVLRFSHCK